MRLICLAVLVALGACSPPAPVPRAERPGDYIKVLDGESLLVRGERVRIAGIQAPRLPPAAGCWAEGALAVQAAEELEDMIGALPDVRITHEGRASDGVKIVRLWFGQPGADMSESLQFNGFAALEGDAFPWCSGSPVWSERGAPDVTHGLENNEAFSQWAARVWVARTEGPPQ